MIHRIRTRMSASLAVLGLLLASLGGVGAVTATSASAAHHAKKHHPTKKKAPACHIPQGAHHTDNDPDNHGGPNDGDGCV